MKSDCSTLLSPISSPSLAKVLEFNWFTEQLYLHIPGPPLEIYAFHPSVTIIGTRMVFMLENSALFIGFKHSRFAIVTPGSKSEVAS